MVKLRNCFFGLFCAVAAIASPAQGIFFSTVANFDNANGREPSARLVQGAGGNFYGTTTLGGVDYFYGTVFKMTSGGALTALYTFCTFGSSCPDGYNPQAGLVHATDGNFYGTTLLGGAYSADCVYCGTVFKISAEGELTTLHSFNGTDGEYPVGGLVLASDRNFYGTTAYGGDYSAGTVFKITPSGTLTTLHSFDGSDGAYPYAGLVQDSDGNFYGTTSENETYCASGCGTVFKITPAGVLATLYTFHGTDGAYPSAELVQATDGNFYGTTYSGGTSGNCLNGCGTIFKITPQGALNTLHSFDGADGANPYAGLVQGSDGNFYGTSYHGGISDFGTAFKITPEGALTTLHSFPGTDGAYPMAGLLQAADGNFYGTTTVGGEYGSGTVFRVGVVRTCAACRP